MVALPESLENIFEFWERGRVSDIKRKSYVQGYDPIEDHVDEGTLFEAEQMLKEKGYL